MPNPHTYLYSIDPGSSKDWAVYCAALQGGHFSLVPNPVQTGDSDNTKWPINKLDDLVAQIVRQATEGAAVLVALDAPLNWLRSFNPFIKSSAPFPFDGSPFNIRPCERALSTRPKQHSTKPKMGTLDWLLEELCLTQESGKKKQAQLQSFTESHDGVSVMGFMQAPHGPVVELFTARLRASECTLCFSPKKATQPESRTIYMLESHPAVSLGFWARNATLSNITSIGKCKGQKWDSKRRDQPLHELIPAVKDLVQDIKSEEIGDIPDDDAMDALIGLIHLTEIARGTGDWFGCEELGYFLVPRLNFLPENKTSHQIWEERYEELKQKASQPDLEPTNPNP